jgi:small ligand-binding sensory domain FIST
MKFISLISHQRNSLRAAGEIVERAEGQFRALKQAPDLVLFFATPSHARGAERIATILREAWPHALILGTSAAGVLHPACPMNARPALAVLAASLPDVRLAPVRMDLEDFEESPVCLEKWQGLLEVMPDPQLVIVLADPFTTPIAEILESLSTLAPNVPVVGGLSSGARRPGAHVLVLNEVRHRSGLVGVALSGNVRADVLVSQGCKPIGQVFEVTKAEGNVVLELSGVPAMEALQQMVSDLPNEERHLLQEGLMFGQAVRHPSEGFGRGDFLIRPVVAVDQKQGTISLAGQVGEGDTIRFHVWDDTLVDDLQMLLLPQVVDVAASGGLIFGSWPRAGRGRPGMSARRIQQALGYRVPMAGFFSAGEIGPIRGANYLHMHTVALTLLRPAASRPGDSDVAGETGRLN